MSARIGRNEKPELLFSAVVAGALSDRELRKGLEDAWTTCEWPGRMADQESWLTLYAMAGVDEGHYLRETELRARLLLPETVHLYRAATEGHQADLSWTSSFPKAHWFATRFDGFGSRPLRIYEIDAPRVAVLATFNKARGEHEYVIDTGLLSQPVSDIVAPEAWEDLLEP
ncbi:hypothetical protein G7067_05740 [Leucobacter insecticola]|uniref:Uncharacterized protein n=1 Tax=Leucobacter insecticola TaxID=2714934 RepID=A0A6G8FI57_9MICO|nr:hypothetical protein [Leucobacter insecticola]QIM16031.1 hypothetical protein G7067_05740 [Leucobacter insecticola]